MIKVTQKAKEQLQLLLENDYTLEGKGLRINISGKECDGFVYGVGFDQKRESDKAIGLFEGLELYLDPFAAFYLKNITLDYQTDFENDAEGLVVTNHDQHLYKDKFWKAAPELTPTFTHN